MEAVARRLQTADSRLAARLNSTARRWTVGRSVTSAAAGWLAGVEVVLMGALAVAGRRQSATRMLCAVGLVYVVSEVLGRVWPRERPFVRLSAVEALVPHDVGRSFPSRHVASGLAMAVIGYRVHPLYGSIMAGVASLLGVSRVASGLHYPSDVLAGALVGGAVGRLLRDEPRPPV